MERPAVTSKRHVGSRLWRSVQTGWEQFWFEPVPAEIFALLRIVFGLLGLLTLAGQLPTSRFWWASGIVPIPPEGGLRDAIVSSGFGTIAGELLFWWFAAALVAMVVGYGARVAIALAFAAANTQFIWNILPLSGANAVFVVMLFCLVWAETGAVWSVDAWLERRRQPGDTPRLASPTGPVLPLRLMQFQLAMIYLNSGLWKVHDVAWRDGTALHWAMSNNVFHRFPSALPFVNETTLAFLTYLTLFWEIAFPLLLLHRWTRLVALIIGVMLHLGIWVTMEVGPFTPIMLAAYIAFIPPRRIARWAGRSSGEPVHATV